MLAGVDPKSDVPVFRQLMDEVRSAVARGAYRPGEMLPSVRQMALQALVNPNTVARAYRELEREGIVTTRPGLGVFVAQGADEQCRRDCRAALAEKAAALVAEARRSGVDDGELKLIFDAGLAAANETIRERPMPGTRPFSPRGSP